MSSRRIALLRRVRATLRREVPIWGLAAPVTVEGGDGAYRIEATSEDDALIAEGFVSAEAAMFTTDLRRRLWSGRLSELIGDAEVAPSVRSPDLDHFVRILGFRAGAERSFRHLDSRCKARLGLYATGVNSWIDSGLWRKQQCWEQAGSRPRLWAPSDCLLLAQAANRMHIATGCDLAISGEALGAGWTEELGWPVQQLWELLRSAPHRTEEFPRGNLPSVEDLLRPQGIRWEGAVGADVGADVAPSTVPAGTPAHRSVAGSQDGVTPPSGGPLILPLTILPDGDNHRYESSHSPPARLRARRHDIEIGEAGPLRRWVRSNERGGVISDLLSAAGAQLAPAGQAFLWSWEGELHGGGRLDTNRKPSISLGLDVVPPRAGPTKIRLVPIDSGAW
jgi:hypothetical protein